MLTTGTKVEIFRAESIFGVGCMCNGRGSLTPDSEPGVMDEGVGVWTDKDKTWGNGQGKDVEWARQGRGVEAEQLLVVKADYG